MKLGFVHRKIQRMRSAFTMIEMMVAIFIFSLVLTSIYDIWTLILGGKQSASYAAEETQRTRIGMRALSEALMSARMFQANTNYYSFEVDGESDFSALSFIAYLPPGFIGSGLYDGIPLRRVSFVIEANEEGRNALVLYQRPLLLDEEYEDVIPPIELTTDISLFTVDFWDTNEVDWINYWDDTNTLPQIARISLGYGYSGRGPAQLDTRIIAMSGNVIPSDIQGTVNQNMTMGNQSGNTGNGGNGGNSGGSGGNSGNSGSGGNHNSGSGNSGGGGSHGGSGSGGSGGGGSGGGGGGGSR